MRVHRARTGGYTSFAHDVRLLLDLVTAGARPDLAQEFRASVLLALIGSLAINTPTDVLSALVLVGQRRRAEEQASLLDTAPIQQAYAYLAIAEASARTAPSELPRLARLAVSAAARLPDSEGLMTGVGEQLARWGQAHLALRTLDEHSRWQVELAVVAESAASGRAQEAMHGARAMTGHDRAVALAVVAAALLDAGNAEAAAAAAEECLGSLGDDQADRGQSLLWHAKYFLAESPTNVCVRVLAGAGGTARALEVARGRQDPLKRSAMVRVAVAEALRVGAVPVLDALRMAEEIDLPAEKCHALAVVSVRLSGNGEREAAAHVAHHAMSLLPSGPYDPPPETIAMVADALVASGQERAAIDLVNQQQSWGRDPLKAVVAALVRAGRTQIAYAMIDDLEPGTDQDDAWEKLADSALSEGRTAEALTAVTRISHGYGKSRIISRYADTIVGSDSLELFLTAAREITERVYSVASIAAVAHAAARSGEPIALPLIEEAIHAGEHLRDEFGLIEEARGGLLSMVAWYGTSVVEAPAGIRSLVRAVPRPWRRIDALCELARAVAARGIRAESASEILEEAADVAATDTDNHVYGLGCVAVGFASLGNQTRAEQLLTEVLSIAATADDGDARSGSLIGVARGLARSGHVQMALDFAERCDPQTRQIAQAAVVEEVDAVDGDEADRLIRQLAVDPMHRYPFGSMRTALSHDWVFDRNRKRLYTEWRMAASALGRGRRDVAATIASRLLDLIEGMSKESDQVSALDDIGGIVVATGSASRAFRIAAQIGAPDRRASALVNLAERLAHAGEDKAALAACRRAVDTLPAVAHGLSQHTDSSKAYLTGNAIRVLQRLPVSEEAGELARSAADIAGQLSDRAAKASALRACAYALADHGRAEDSLATARAALAVAHTIEYEECVYALNSCLRALEISDPDALTAVADALLDLEQWWKIDSLLIDR